MQNAILIFATGLIPMLVGFVWYNNSFGFGKAWMAETGMTQEEMDSNFSPLKVFGFTYLFGVFLAVAMMPMTIHQMGLTSMLAETPGASDATTEIGRTMKSLLDTYGSNFRTFKHGAFHGILSSIFLALPVVGISALFERRSWKYIFIHVGYWVITFALVGGTICQFLDISKF
jgi:Protein of unknown function (DUF1761)